MEALVTRRSAGERSEPSQTAEYYCRLTRQDLGNASTITRGVPGVAHSGGVSLFVAPERRGYSWPVTLA